MALSRACLSSSPTVGEPDRSRRRARVLTKKPIRPSISARPRLAVGVPITTSCWPERRESNAAHAASNVINILVLRRTGMIQGQLQQRRCTLQSLLPVPRLTLQYLSLDPLPLPHRVVGILDPELRQRIWPAGVKRRVQRAQLAGEDPHRPAVGDNVMHGDQQRMLVLRKTNQAAANQRTRLQIKRAARLLRAKTRQLQLRVLVMAQIVLDKIKAARKLRRNPLLRLAIHKGKCGTQGLMTSHNPVQCTAKSTRIKLAPKTHSKRYVIGLAHSLHLRQKPQPLLRKRQSK